MDVPHAKLPTIAGLFVGDDTETAIALAASIANPPAHDLAAMIAAGRNEMMREYRGNVVPFRRPAGK